MKKLPIGIQTFLEIVEEDYLYIDKTKLIYRLITSGKVYFLSRPRRFGKSLLLSTLEAIFKGKKEFFKGLWIYNGFYPHSERPKPNHGKVFDTEKAFHVLATELFLADQESFVG